MRVGWRRWPAGAPSPPSDAIWWPAGSTEADARALLGALHTASELTVSLDVEKAVTSEARRPHHAEGSAILELPCAEFPSKTPACEPLVAEAT